jgi:thiol-disulfide isomerase/thioredoxin
MSTSFNKIKLAAGLAFCLAWTALAAPPKEGDVFPDLHRFGLEGTLPELQGKIVLVDFFASWCDPCKESFPAMEELHQKYHDQGLVIVAVNVDKKKSDMDDFLKKHPASFAVVRDAANKLVGEVKIPTMPSSFLLDRNGKVHAFHRGFKGAETKKKYTEEIEALLK